MAREIERRCRPEVVVLHDRSVPRSKANIDHIVIAPSGVWVVDTKRYKGKVEVARPLFGKAALRVAGRDRSNLLVGLAKQLASVEPVVRRAIAGVPVHSALCFVDADLPLIGVPKVGGVPILGRRGLVKRLNADGPVGLEATVGVARALAEAFPSA